MAVLTNKATATYNLLGVPLTIDSNTVNFTTVVNVVTLTKSCSPTAGKSGDTVTFTITALATAAITGAVITDNLTGSGFTFVAGSVKVDGTSVPAANPNTGITLGAVGLNITKTITFDVTVD